MCKFVVKCGVVVGADAPPAGKNLIVRGRGGGQSKMSRIKGEGSD